VQHRLAFSFVFSYWFRCWDRAITTSFHRSWSLQCSSICSEHYVSTHFIVFQLRTLCLRCWQQALTHDTQASLSFVVTSLFLLLNLCSGSAVEQGISTLSFSHAPCGRNHQPRSQDMDNVEHQYSQVTRVSHCSLDISLLSYSHIYDIITYLSHIHYLFYYDQYMMSYRLQEDEWESSVYEVVTHIRLLYLPFSLDLSWNSRQIEYDLMGVLANL
jgi:hypothetical protein